MSKLRKWIVTMGLIFVMSFSFAGSSYAFFGAFDTLADALNNFFSSAKDFINSIVTSFNYINGSLTSIADWTVKSITFFAGGNPTKTIGLVPDAAKLLDWLTQQGFFDDFVKWLNDHYEDYRALDKDNDHKIEDSEVRDAPDIGAIAAYLQDKKGYSQDRIMEVIAENSSIATTYNVYNDKGMLAYSYFYITDENGNRVTGTGRPEDGVVNGYRAQVTFYDNGRVSQIIGWAKSGDSGDWEKRIATFYDTDNDGTNDYAEGFLELIGVNIPAATGFTAEYGKVVFDSLGRISEVYIDGNGDGTGSDSDKFETLKARYHYDAQGRLTRIDVYGDGGEIVAKVEMGYAGGRLAFQKIFTKDSGGSWTLASTITYHYGPNDVLLYTKEISTGTVEGVNESDVSEKELGIDLNNNGTLEDSISYDFNNDGDTLDTVTLTIKTTTITWYLFGRRVFVTRQNELVDTQVTTDNDPRPRASPTVTGNLFYDAQTDTWYMKVYVWTGVGDPNNIHVDRNYWNSLSEEEKQRIRRMAEEAGGKVVIEENPITIELDISNLSDSDLEFLQNNIGNILTLHGWTIDGLIKNGYILEVVGFGKWSYEPYHPYDE